MKKYCPKCGKNIEKDTCECQDKSGLFQTILDFATEPIDTVNNFVNKATKESNYLLILITSVIISFSITNPLTNFKSLFFFPTFRILLVVVILVIASFGLFTLIFNLLMKQSNPEVTFEDTLKIVSASSISLVYAFLITTVINLLFNVYTLIIILIGVFVFGYLIIETINNNNNKIDKNKTLQYFTLTILIVALVITILF